MQNQRESKAVATKHECTRTIEKVQQYRYPRAM